MITSFIIYPHLEPAQLAISPSLPHVLERQLPNLNNIPFPPSSRSPQPKHGRNTLPALLPDEAPLPNLHRAPLPTQPAPEPILTTL
jgi:hypothetical protein